MTVEQLPVFLAKLIEHGSAFMGMSKNDAQWVIEKPKEAIALFVDALRISLATADSVNDLLELVGTIMVPETTTSFHVSELFVKDVSDSAQVKIYDVGSNFRTWFGKMIVGPHSGSTLSYHTLGYNAYDEDIISALGGEATSEISLAEIWALMLEQKNGGSGSLLTSGKANIFYVRDDSSVLCAVFINWFSGGWCVAARKFGVCDWRGVRRVFARSPVGATIGNS